MLGAIIGDIVGSRWEFNPTNDYHFEWLSQKNDFTDDTICTVAVADALLNHRDYGESIHDWCRKYPYPLGGYGGRFAQWVHSDNPQPYNSFGNGSAMRVSPVAYWYNDIGELLDAAAATALPSHNHDEGIKGAQTVALAIYYAIKMHDFYPQPGNKEIAEVLDKCVKFSGYNINIRKEDVINKFDETCQGTVPVALWIIGQSASFEDAVRRAVCLGADADTLGAIVGSIAEAIWGIPEEMKSEIMSFLPDEMKQIVNKFYERMANKSSYRYCGMETIFDHNPTKKELQRFGGMKQFEFCKKLLGAYYIYEDDANYHLGLLFSMRGDEERANSYFAKVKNKEMLKTLIQDC